MTMYNRREAARIVNQFASFPEASVYKDLQVWVKNYDPSRLRKGIFNSLGRPMYLCNDCDLICLPQYFVVIWKVKYLIGQYYWVRPHIFQYDPHASAATVEKDVFVQRIQIVGDDIEILFTDKEHLDPMTLVIKRASEDLKESMVTRFRIARPEANP